MAFLKHQSSVRTRSEVDLQNRRTRPQNFSKLMFKFFTGASGNLYLLLEMWEMAKWGQKFVLLKSTLDIATNPWRLSSPK